MVTYYPDYPQLSQNPRAPFPLGEQRGWLSPGSPVASREVCAATVLASGYAKSCKMVLQGFLQIGVVLTINKCLLRLFFATENYLEAGGFKSF